MYFESREQAGQLLAEQLALKYRYENTAVVALTTGGVLVGKSIAAYLHCPLTMLVTEKIDIPGESLSFGAVSQAGNFTYNSEFTEGEIDGYTSEFHGYLDDKKREAFHHINELVGDGGTIDRDLLRERVVILVADGFVDGAILSVALDFLKPIHIAKLVVAAPVATIPAVDQLHMTADEMHILDVKENFMGIDHYFDNNDMLTQEEAVALINESILTWQ
ncbi:MAG: hypothetical protein WBP22_01405 [Candidatus Saccharimonas sp.]